MLSESLCISIIIKNDKLVFDISYVFDLIFYFCVTLNIL